MELSSPKIVNLFVFKEGTKLKKQKNSYETYKN